MENQDSNDMAARGSRLPTPICSAGDSIHRNLAVDGTDAISGLFEGDGELPPFVVFDVDAQEIIAGPFRSREEAEAHRQEILSGILPRLDEQSLATQIKIIDESK